MALACPQCSAEMPDDCTFCAACGAPMSENRPTLGTTGHLNDRVAGALAYFVFAAAIFFLLVEPYKKNHFIRFHSFQSVFTAIAGVAVALGLRLAFFLLTLVPEVGHLTALLVSLAVLLGWLCMWAVLIVKALQGEIFKLPWLGDLAEKQANLRS